MEPRATTVRVVALVFLVALALHVGFALAFEVPAPAVHDEFAYLLTADTFAAGRLTNPTHPLWEHFDTFHVFQHPTYQAKYPPGQGAWLALGQVSFGHPAAGIWLGLAAGLAAVAWMLCAVVPGPWALLASLLLLVNAPLFRSWGQTYWGGGAALFAGALVLGGLLRLRERARAGPAIALGAGLFLLASTRPLEGALMVALTLPAWPRAVRRWRAEPGARPGIRVGLPVLVALGVTVAWTLVYDRALTGDPFTLPYANWDKYASPHDAIQWYAGSPEIGFVAKMGRLQRFFCGDVLLLALPFLLVRRRSPVVRGSLVVVVLLTLVSVLTSRAWPHYLAPAVGLMALLLVEALRGLAALRGGAFLAAGLVLGHLGVQGWALARPIRSGPTPSWHRERHAMVDFLREAGGEHLVLVRYPDDHLVHEEWVYNAADIDAAPIVWARDLGEAENHELLEYFADRTAWRVEPDGLGTRLEPYPRSEEGAGGEPAHGGTADG